MYAKQSVEAWELSHDVRTDEDYAFQPIRLAIRYDVAHSVHRNVEHLHGLRECLIHNEGYSQVLTTDSKGSNRSARGLSRIQPRMTMVGITNSAVCCSSPKSIKYVQSSTNQGSRSSNRQQH